MALLNGEARLVTLQVYCKLSLIPACIKREENKPRTLIAQSKGQKFLEPVKSVGCLDFLSMLNAEGYVLVDASTRPIGTQALTKFIFAEASHAVSCEEFEEQKPFVLAVLQVLLRDAAWRAEGWVNPYFRNGEEIAELCSILIKLDDRSPLVEVDGQPVLRWQKDEKGERISDKPVPVQPEKFLQIVGDDIVVV